MVDETTDTSNKEQVVICFRWVDNKLRAHEEFVGIFQVESTTAGMLYSVICDVLLRLNLSKSKLRGQWYDGASSMSGARSGVATRICVKNPEHCVHTAMDMP